MKPPCQICGNVSHARGLCRKHWDDAKGLTPWHKAHPEKQRARVNKWRASNPAKAKEHDRKWRELLKEERKAACRTYRATHLERMRQLGRDWSKANPEKWKVTNAERRAAKHRAFASWASSEFEELVISEIYDLAIRKTKLTGLSWHVDHIVPLRSKTVCGLHCSANLQVIPGSENHRKGNRTWPNMP